MCALMLSKSHLLWSYLKQRAIMKSGILSGLFDATGHRKFNGTWIFPYNVEYKSQP